jgi:flagellar basal-body rod protein FlgC
MPSLRDAMTASASALDVQRARLEVAVSNLANAESTTGINGGPYRRREVLLEAIKSGSGDAFGVRVAAIVEDQSPLQRRFDPGHAQADETGHIELSNVDVPTEMVDMLGAARAYQANLAAIALIRETVQKALEIGRG